MTRFRIALLAFRSAATVASLMLSACILVSASPQPQSGDALPPEPKTFSEPFRFDRTTGALTLLERVKLKDNKVGSVVSQGPFKADVQYYSSSIDGPVTSPVRFTPADTMVLVMRLTTTMEKIGRSNLVRLVVQNGKRFTTKSYIPLDTRSYGEPIVGMNRFAPKLAALSFQFTLNAKLAPGEYGLAVGTFDQIEPGSTVTWAFGID
jgi:hypothetical protein